MNSPEQCLVIMPFGNTKDEELFYDMVYTHIILPAFEEASASGSRIDREVVGDEHLTAAIEERLRSAPLVIADLSGNNPNVLYELGFRRAHGKPFIGISRKPVDAAFWPKSFLLIDYTGANSVAKIAKAIKKKYAEVSDRLKAENELTKLTEKVRAKGGFDNSFQDRLAAWRIRRTWEQVELIQKGETEFEAKTSTAYVAHLFHGIMEMLEDGEEYLTVTNVGFWSDEGVGHSPFLESNVKAAMRGTKIQRVFLIDKNDWTQETRKCHIRALLEKHKEAHDKLDLDKRGNMIVKCLLSEDFNRDRDRYGHFGLARTLKSNSAIHSDSVVIVPRYTSSIPGVAASHLWFIFSKGASPDLEAMSYMHKFKAAFSNSAAYHLSAFLQS